MMEKKVLRRVRFFGAWQDEKEEAWLEEMACQGWHLREVGFPLVYHFVRGPQQRHAYRLDYTSLRRQDRQDYYQLFADAGWEWVGEMGGWQYFRKLVADGEQAEIYTDSQSKIAKYQRVLGILVALLPIYIVLFRVPEGGHLFTQIVAGFMFLLMLVYMYAIVSLIRRIQQLKKGT